MASAVEDSVSSIPTEQLAQLRNKLLQNPGSDAETHIATSQPGDLHATDASANDDSKDTPRFAPATVPESANAYQTPFSSPRAHSHPPRMNVAKSATEAEMEAMIHPSPSQEAFTTLTRASSFHGFPGGDTQPMESQVYRDFTTSAKKSVVFTPARAMEEYTYDTCGTDKTARTLVEGDTQFADLAQRLASPGAQSAAAFDEDDFEPTQIQSESNHGGVGLFPETPAVSGHKRRHSGDLLTSVTTGPKTLGFSQMFGGFQGRPILSATQAFNQTQAPSSPAVDGPRSDPAFTRPSPNLINRLATSSPPLPSTSSPIGIMKASTAGEPRDNYTSIRESQERKASLRLRAELYTQRNIDDLLSDEEEDEEQEDTALRQATRKRLQRAKSDQALRAMSKFAAPSRQDFGKTSRPKSAPIVDLTTPAIVKTKQVEEAAEPDDVDESYQSGEEGLVEDEGVEHIDLDNDQYDELSQTVIRNPANDADDDNDYGHLTTDAVNADEETVVDHGNDMDTVPESTNIPTNENVESGAIRTQHSTVADSQPSQKKLSQSIPRQKTQSSSSVSLLVPGSQYAGKTSQDQAQLARQSWTLPGQRYSNPPDEAPQRVLSSPPLSPENSRDSTDAAANEDGGRSMPRQEIPESDIPMSDVNHADSPRPAGGNGRLEAETNNGTTFSTAPTHLSQPMALSRKSSSLMSPIKLLASQQSHIASQSPITAAGVRRLGDIAAMQSPRTSNDSQVSVDAIMNDIITVDDQEFLQVMSSPGDDRPLKRRRLSRRATASNKVANPDFSEAADGFVAQNNDAEGPTEANTEKVAEHEFSSSKALRESPSKANEMPVQSSENQLEDTAVSRKTATRSLSAIKHQARMRQDVQSPMEDGTHNMTPNSVREREEAGAKAVSQLISKRSRKLVNKNKAAKHTTSKTLKKRKGDRILQETTAITADAISEEPSKLEGMQNIAVSAVDGKEDSDQQVVAPHRIFTLFKGTLNNFYTATWLHSLPDGLSHRVRFDDGTQTSIEPQHIRRLELRIGDQVKINLDGMRGKNWVITNFNAPARDGVAETDIFGRARLQVQAKSSRISMPANPDMVDSNSETVEVAVPDVYLTHTMWPHFSERQFSLPTAVKSIISRAATPSSTAQTPTVETPNSRTRRNHGVSTKGATARSLYVRDEGVATADGSAGIGLFSNMAFAISFVSNEGDKGRVMRAIRAQGGIILDLGFDELFHLPDESDASPTSPGGKHLSDAHRVPAGSSILKLQPQFEGLGFVALVADRHSRRAKYMQALALGIPTLSSRWVSDSLDTARNVSLTGSNATPLPWTKYLLPAGESSYLAGAIRSRTILEHPIAGANLSDTLMQRSLLLNGDGVLIVASKKGKGLSERSKTYAFLTLALGAGVVKHVADLQDAKALTHEAPETWKWVYVDGSVAEASSILFGGKRGAGGGKKRKRDDDSTKGDADTMCVGSGGVHVVNDEFVIQSLILGALVD